MVAKPSQVAESRSNADGEEPETLSIAEGSEPTAPPLHPASRGPAGKPPLVTEDQVLDGVTMPDVKAHVVEQAEEVQQATPGGAENIPRSAPSGKTPTAGKTDKYGNPFDPVIHKTNDDGSPKINQTGAAKGFIACKSGKAGSASRLDIPAKDAQPHGSGGSASSAIDPKFEMMGQVCADATFNLGMLIGGQDFAPRVNEKTGENEPVVIKSAWTSYCAAKNFSDMPPGLLLCVILGGYAGKRWNMPAVVERRKSLKERIYFWWSKRAEKKAQSKEARIKELEKALEAEKDKSREPQGV